MTANPFDQAGRYAIKLDPPGMLAWLLQLNQTAFQFRGWLDTRTLPFPGAPDRICDTVAHVLDVQRGLLPWAIVAEVELEPDFEMPGRALQYLGRLWVEKKPVQERGDRFAVGAVVNLTGLGNSTREMVWPEAGLETTLRVSERNLSQLVASAVLAEVAQGQATAVMLVFIPLMQGGAEPAIIAQWLQLASAEPDARRRAEYGGLALVMAEATGCWDVWKQALQGWNMKVSQQVLEWQAEARKEGRDEGRVEGQAEMLLAVLEERFGALPPELTTALQALTDAAQLRQLGRLAARAASLIDFRQQAQL